MQRPVAEMASFAAIAGAETAPTREFGRHAFDITELLRVSIGRTRARTWDPMIKSPRSSDLHSELADCRISQGIKLREEQIPRTI
jgi:hypothetical protein